MEIIRIIHKGYKELEEHIKRFPNSNLAQTFGKYHYIYIHKKTEISLIKLVNYFMNGQDWWEAHQLKPKEKGLGRWKTKKEAEKKIKEHLGIDDLQELVINKLKKIKDEKEKHKRKNP